MNWIMGKVVVMAMVKEIHEHLKIDDINHNYHCWLMFCCCCQCIKEE